MCLYAIENEIFIAQEDIAVYKIMYPMKRDWLGRRTARSAIKGFTYRLGKTYSLGKDILIDTVTIRRGNENVQQLIVEEGYHSYLSDVFMATGHGMRFYRCIIPKGSQYVLGGHELVSNKIRIVEELIPNSKRLVRAEVVINLLCGIGLAMALLGMILML